MSWTQGVLPREEMSERLIAKLECAYTIKTGLSDRVEYITWFTVDGSDAIAHFESNRGFRIGWRNADSDPDDS